jgi:maltose alpha-D-glucosyltransferase/alpha-amylase
LPFYPSPLKDDGYDIASYTAIHPSYGTMADFKVFMREAHARGLRVITELVINHTSDQHPWFQRARSSPPGSRWRDFYVWTDTPQKYKAARIIFKDFETSNWTWDPVAKAYFWHRFYHHQPDLNFDNPEVHDAVTQVLDYWMDMGVDGLRLDAVPYLYEREGTSCENLPETHAYLKKLRAHVDRNFSDRMLLAEANQWPEDSRPYFGEGDECHVAFHFPLMPRLFMSVAMEDRYPIIDIMQQTPDIPDSCQWALFLRNHDELTLEMVTDEDRDYMYRTYASDRQARINLGIRRRLAPLMENHRDRIELMNGLLFSFPGTPIIYYGDEIGMGDNIYLGDRNGVRTPMQWSADRNAGFSRANPQRLFLPVIIDPAYHYEAVNVEAQQNNTHSLLWWMKRLIELRKQYRAFGRGTLEFLHPENRKVLAMIREYDDETILVVANLSRFAQPLELDLSRYAGRVPVELFGHTKFPPIGQQPMFLSMTPYSFYWFSLTHSTREAIDLRKEGPRLAANSWDELLSSAGRDRLEPVLAAYIRERRWFGAKALELTGAEIVESIPLPGDQRLLFVRLRFVDGPEQMYVVPLSMAWGDAAVDISRQGKEHVVAALNGSRREGVLHESSATKVFGRTIMGLLKSRKTHRGEAGELRSVRIRGRGDRSLLDTTVEPTLSKAEASNTSLLYGDRVFVKMYRKVEAGVNPDFEINRFLTEETRFAGVPALLGALEYAPYAGGEPITLALATEQIGNARDAWEYTLDELARFFDRIVRQAAERAVAVELPTGPVLELAGQQLPPDVETMISTYIRSAEIIGQRTAEMHLALASAQSSDFTPEPFTPHYQRSIYETMRTQGQKALSLLRRRLKEMSPENRSDAEAVIAMEAEIQKRFRAIVHGPIDAMRIRTHGDFHLGQMLYTGKDFAIIDFEGEPSRPLSERRIKRSALRDVAGMLRSFHYASHAVLLGKATGVTLRDIDMKALGPYAELWQRWVSAIFLRKYLETAAGSAFLPQNAEGLAVLLDAYTLEKALYEVYYELNHRPNWVGIPLRGILDILGTRSRVE